MTAIPSDNQLLSDILSSLAKLASDRHNYATDLPTLPSRPLTTATTTAQGSNESLNPFSTTDLWTGVGLQQTFQELVNRICPSLSNTIGSRYFGLVTGGVTPAAWVADWLVTTYDQNALMYMDPKLTGQSIIDQEAMMMYLNLIGLSTTEFDGIITSGSTGSNIMGLSLARQVLGHRVFGIDYSIEGYDGRMIVLTNMAHASVGKAASILGIGRKQVIELGNEIDESYFENLIQSLVHPKDGISQKKAVMLLLGFGEVNTGYFPKNTRSLAKICGQYGVYLHIDGAFGIYAKCSKEYESLADGLELADSITGCGHKWINVPYDCGFFIYRKSWIHSLESVFTTAAEYLQPSKTGDRHPMNLSIENSRRFRSLPVWATLRAYGQEGYSKIIEENCRFAKTMFDWMQEEEEVVEIIDQQGQQQQQKKEKLFTVLTDHCPLNIVVFAETVAVRLYSGSVSSLEDKEKNQKLWQARNLAFLDRLNMTGTAYFSPTTLNGRPGIRAAISCWRTTVEQDWEPVKEMMKREALAFKQSYVSEQ